MSIQNHDLSSFFPPSFLFSEGLPHTDSHSNDDMEIKPGIAEMIREEERVS